MSYEAAEMQMLRGQKRASAFIAPPPRRPGLVLRGLEEQMTSAELVKEELHSLASSWKWIT